MFMRKLKRRKAAKPNVPDTDKKVVKKVLVIGAGVAGIQAAKALLQEGFKVLVIEREGDVGGVWVRNYVGFGLQVPWDLYQFPDFPYPDHLRPTQEYPTGSDVLSYVQAYARHFGLYSVIRFHSQVLQLRPLPNNAGWGALYVNIQSQQFFYVTIDYVIICSGIYSLPFLPTYEGSDVFLGQQIHAKDFTDLSIAIKKRVIVVGAGKTALDCVANVASNKIASSVTLLYRQAHWPLPRRIFGTSIRRLLFNRFTAALLPPYYTTSRWGMAKSRVTAPIKRLWWRTMEGLVIRKFGMAPEARPQVNLPQDLFYGGQIIDDRFDAAVSKGYVHSIRGEIHRFTRNGIILQDGSFLPADLVLYCTGYAKSYDILDGATRARLRLAKDGLYLYRNVIPPAIPNMAFIGSEVSTFNNILTHSLQALWLTRILQGKLKLPSVAMMEEDIRQQQAWRRQVMPPQRHRGSVVMLYQQAYHDQLLKDLKIKSKRKRVLVPFSECFGTYTANDYRGLYDDEGAEDVVYDNETANAAKAAADGDTMDAYAQGRNGLANYSNNLSMPSSGPNQGASGRTSEEQVEIQNGELDGVKEDTPRSSSSRGKGFSFFLRGRKTKGEEKEEITDGGGKGGKGGLVVKNRGKKKMSIAKSIWGIGLSKPQRLEPQAVAAAAVAAAAATRASTIASANAAAAAMNSLALDRGMVSNMMAGNMMNTSANMVQSERGGMGGGAGVVGGTSMDLMFNNNNNNNGIGNPMMMVNNGQVPMLSMMQNQTSSVPNNGIAMNINNNNNFGGEGEGTMLSNNNSNNIYNGAGMNGIINGNQMMMMMMNNNNINNMPMVRNVLYSQGPSQEPIQGFSPTALNGGGNGNGNGGVIHNHMGNQYTYGPYRAHSGNLENKGGISSNDVQIGKSGRWDYHG
mmetsp:Transcript_4229/g.7522  ORF Transcript_4229/g.7522 Transcript_4229/m.7522 type:complete len:908 (-) Transcript_4229:593-3316(-)|eukprot:CAMPEP_0175045478 /NCGR_PEP_ID=MMETSP0052_2-20121109/4448_1 /TAXON_ID=51329 ORGANISM="Polytomella parva, Strain SAG 63-3" /NCGR_SAMPLE_ID=MMETSP0052_2 /ASSEMBLY_ACC=CAM_ASM_000194 /LENGTH=907 /DNA_ID=CAMNT_0016309019 /DNA_START=36 /DNA_END=2759 /DNA_ORIENTATION=+